MKKESYFRMRMSDRDKESLQRQAEQMQMTMSEYVVYLIRKNELNDDRRKEMKTLESKMKIVAGLEIRFAELWDGNGDGEELLHSGAISTDNENVVEFEIIEESDDILNTLVKIIDIF